MTASTTSVKVVPPVLTAILTSRVFVRKEDTVADVNASIKYYFGRNFDFPFFLRDF